jgi:hypothetical protein
VEIRRTVLGDQLRQKVSKTPISINKPGMVAHICNSSYTGGIGRKIVV